ncbi:MAG: DUF427 domain-containing protein [Balneolales bacterium]
MKNTQAILIADKFEIIPTAKRVRIFYNNKVIADSSNAVLLREQDHVPIYYFPREDVRHEFLEQTDHRSRCPHKGEASYWTVRVGKKNSEDAAWAYLDPAGNADMLSDYLAFYWSKMDAWFEEDEKVDVHARDPYHRIDILKSSRHIKVVIQGEVITETKRPTLLFETKLPVRYYIPRLDVDFSFLEPGSIKTHCPYKGEAKYYSVRAGDKLLANLIWTYPYAKTEALAVADQLCFYQEKTDEFTVSED